VTYYYPGCRCVVPSRKAIREQVTIEIRRQLQLF